MPIFLSLLLLLFSLGCAAPKHVEKAAESVFMWRIEIFAPVQSKVFISTVAYGDDAGEATALKLFKSLPQVIGKKSAVFYKTLSVSDVNELVDKLYDFGFINVTVKKLNQ